MKQYKDLKPGLYIQRGEAIKSVSQADGEMWRQLFTGEQGKPSLEKLASSVGWVFTALNERRVQLTGIPYTWRFNGEDSTNPPFRMKMRQLLARTDESMQVYGEAFWYKQRNNGGGLAVRWLDPNSITPDQLTIDGMGEFTSYLRTDQRGRFLRLPAEDVIHFRRLGLHETEPSPSASMATRLAAEVLQGSMTAVASTFGNNALPVFLVHVPPGTSEEQRVSLSERIALLFNPKSWGSKTNRVAGVADGVSITKLSFSPAELGLETIEASKRDEILAAHGVPQSKVMSIAANFAVAENDTLSFIETMKSRFSDIAEEIEDDPDFAGWTLVPQTKKMTALQSRNLAMVEALALATGQPFITGDEARDYLDMEAIGLGIAQAAIMEPEPVTELAEDEPSFKSALWIDDAKRFTSWVKRRDNPDINDFRSNELTQTDKLKIYIKHMTVKYDNTTSDQESYP